MRASCALPGPERPQRSSSRAAAVAASLEARPDYSPCVGAVRCCGRHMEGDKSPIGTPGAVAGAGGWSECARTGTQPSGEHASAAARIRPRQFSRSAGRRSREGACPAVRHVAGCSWSTAAPGSGSRCLWRPSSGAASDPCRRACGSCPRRPPGRSDTASRSSRHCRPVSGGRSGVACSGPRWSAGTSSPACVAGRPCCTPDPLSQCICAAQRAPGKLTCGTSGSDSSKIRIERASMCPGSQLPLVQAGRQLRSETSDRRRFGRSPADGPGDVASICSPPVRRRTRSPPRAARDARWGRFGQ